jgi:hypothetical protein
MLRRLAVVAFAALAVAQTGCHGRVCNFFYRLTHCDGCGPYYGYGPAYASPSYGAPGCSTCVGGPAVPTTGYPVTYSSPAPPMAPAGTPVFTPPAAMPTDKK